MPTATKEAPSKDIVALVEATPVIVLTDEAKFSQFYEAMREECERHEPDLSSDKGRKAIASLAYKVTRTKTAIDDAGKKLNEEARARINAVDEARRKIRQQLDDLRDEVRKPLTDWEQAEEKRAEQAEKEMAWLREMQRVDIADTAVEIEERIAQVDGFTVDPDVHELSSEIVEALRSTALQTLRDAHARLVREEADRAELERLRVQQAERDAADLARREAEEAEQRRIEQEKAEQERIERMRLEAEEKARTEAELKHQEELAAERRRAEEAEAAAQAERDRAAADERARQAEAERAAAEVRAREADRAHRGRIMSEAKQAIMSCGAAEDVAKAIVLDIVGKKIPHVSIQF